MLPLKQAIKLPIILDKPFFKKLSGKIIIEGTVKSHMIYLGGSSAEIYRHNGIILSIEGVIIFKGNTFIADGAIIVGDKGVLEVGENVGINSHNKIMAYHLIRIGCNASIGFDVTICDTDFHSIKNVYTNKKMKAYAPIYIGNNNWIGQGCLLLKGTRIPDYVIVSARSLCNRKYKCKEKSIIYGNPAKVDENFEGLFYRDLEDDIVDYYCHKSYNHFFY